MLARAATRHECERFARIRPGALLSARADLGAAAWTLRGPLRHLLAQVRPGEMDIVVLRYFAKTDETLGRPDVESQSVS
jgi:hypothetical protein